MAAATTALESNVACNNIREMPGMAGHPFEGCRAPVPMVGPLNAHVVRQVPQLQSESSLHKTLHTLALS